MYWLLVYQSCLLRLSLWLAKGQLVRRNVAVPLSWILLSSMSGTITVVN